MVSFRRFLTAFLAITALTALAPAQADSPASLTDIQSQLTSLFQTAKATADGTDLVTAGSVLVLQKDSLLMNRVDQSIATVNVYKDGALTHSDVHGLISGLSKLSRFVPFGGGVAGQAANAAGTSAGNNESGGTREFVAGEKFWVTSIATKADGVYFGLLSDPIKDQRYKAVLKFPFTKGATPAPDDVAGLVSQVIKIDAPEQPQQQAAAAPPPEPKTLSLGQTRDQVIAAFGVPTKVVKLGAKEIDYFTDMKVTFVKEKVTNVE